jgi:hypothetical protein
MRLSLTYCPALPTLLLLLPLWLGGCTVRLEPPRQLSEPEPVFLLDHGRHSSLVLPAEGGGLVRYSYGDWQYYALGRTGLTSGFSALFGNTQAALGRRELQGARTAANVRSQVRIGIEQLIELRAEASDVHRLREELDDLYRAALPARVYNAQMDLDFVPHPEPYTLSHNSNLMVAKWLEALGCRVRGRPVLSNWRVAGD